MAYLLEKNIGDQPCAVKCIVAVMFGRTEEAQQKKSPRVTKEWNEEAILNEIAKRAPEDGTTANRIANWIKQKSDEVVYGKGNQYSSMAMAIKVSGQNVYPIYLWTYGKVQITFQNFRKPLFSQDRKQRELLGKLNEIQGVQLPPDSIVKQPAIELKDLRNEQRLTQFLNVLDWMVGELRPAPGQ